MVDKRARALLLAVIVGAFCLMACTKGNECDKCNTDSDCRQGFFCSPFNDGTRRCGSGVGATTCRVR